MTDRIKPLTADVADYPGVRVIFPVAMAALANQATHFDALVSRIASFFVVATAVAGIGIPLGLQISSESGHKAMFVLVAVPAGLWLWTAVVAFRGMSLGTVQRVDEPTWLRKYLARLEPGRVELVLFPVVEKHYAHNRKVLTDKRRLADLVYRLTVVTVVAVVAYSTLALIARLVGPICV